MKKATLMAGLLLPLALLAQKKGELPYTIQGQVESQKPGKVYLMLRNGDKPVIDSAEVKDGQFTLTGTIIEPVLAKLQLVTKDAALLNAANPGPHSKDILSFFLDKGTTSIQTPDSLFKATVQGSRAQKDLDLLNGQLKGVTDEMNALKLEYRQYYIARDQENMNRLQPRFDELEARQKAVFGDFLKKHRNSSIAMFVLAQYAGYDLDVKDVTPRFKSLAKEVRNSFAGKAFAKRLDAAQKTDIGQQAMDFSQADVDGKQVSLASFRGKYVLVDFWASWCGPCRAENPNVVKAYSKFKDKGFDILSVSLDEKREKWLAAIEVDNLTWTHVSDLKGWSNAAAELYSIRAIPQNLLLDPKGRIVAKNLRGDLLEKKLEEIVK
ncbi:AhpC/TSA family protein [Chitinophaga pendula]|uniref:TlpA disulfide reductase family protein n=1 Tax=Chitinophaga TaxID=79328 RepID=UPI000BB02026|nr:MULTISPECIES: TlpA disulfide reductase family protein [Chitinophaga]ASZ11435.1 hypothetical protein CK934_10930 [Chitinophaga sp. MD30]UCJ05559.1 AhpC/TSA family protein [Chitinophaga pendula]